VEFELRRKRGAHLFLKHRYLSAQMPVMLEGVCGGHGTPAPMRCARLASGLRRKRRGDVHEPQANI